MKQCPKCQGFELYEDEEDTCPYCGTSLVLYDRKNRREVDFRENPTSDRPPVDSRRETSRSEEPVFESRDGNRFKYRGVVVSVSPTSRYISSSMKWFNAVFRGQPYQIGNPVYETVLRIEEICQSRIPDKMRSLIFYGELGELNTGDDVTICAVRKYDRFIVQSLMINDIESLVHANGLISASVVRFLSLLTIVLIGLFVMGIVSFFTSGGFLLLISALAIGIVSVIFKIAAALAPLIGIAFVFWIFFHKNK